ncbi:MAG: CAP domain-containing protein [Paracoccus sp. (in: a-proteobacteria)]
MTSFRYMAAAFAACLLLAACLKHPEQPDRDLRSRTSTSSPRLPMGIIRVSGHNQTQVATPGQPVCPSTSPTQAESALTAINILRTQHGLAPLRTSKKLQRAAEKHACEMARRGVMSHAGLTSTGPADRIKRQGYRPLLTAENIAAGKFDLHRVQTEWVRSPKHLANMMIAGLQHYGIGRAIAADGKSVFWAAVYAKGRD